MSIPVVCPQLDKILETICGTTITDQYFGFHQYRDHFLADLVESIGACHAGTIWMVAGTDYIGLPEWAQIDWAMTNKYYDLARCAGSERFTFLCSFQLGDFQRTDTVMNILRKRAYRIRVSHMTAGLVDRNQKTIEFFDPFGYKPWVPPIVHELQRYFHSLPEFTDYKMISPLDYCPRISWQGIAQDEMCANWSMLYLVLRLTCPNLSRSEVIDLLLSRGPDYLHMVMTHWVCYMWQYAEARGIIQADEYSLVLSVR